MYANLIICFIYSIRYFFFSFFLLRFFISTLNTHFLKPLAHHHSNDYDEKEEQSLANYWVCDFYKASDNKSILLKEENLKSIKGH
jgi:hypothetical protein